MGERDRIQQLAEWWAQASQESRWLFLRKTIEGPPSKEIPPLRLELHQTLLHREQGNLLLPMRRQQGDATQGEFVLQLAFSPAAVA